MKHSRGEKPRSGVAEVESGVDVGGKLVHFDGRLAFTSDDLLCACWYLLITNRK
jgi:hypothetical protein